MHSSPKNAILKLIHHILPEFFCIWFLKKCRKTPGVHNRGKEFTGDTNDNKTAYPLSVASFFADSFSSLRLFFRLLTRKTDCWWNKKWHKDNFPWNLHWCLYTASQSDCCVRRQNHISGCLPHWKRLSYALLQRQSFQSKVTDHHSGWHGIHLHTEPGFLRKLWDFSIIRKQRHLSGRPLRKCHRW